MNMKEHILSVTAVAQVLPNGQMAYHIRGWEITYDIEAIEDWLLCQAR